ncbi:nucleolar protein [Babesia caballi]|uniref:Nucleolar protein n=1 Tax=Babesia caballi TaxID=5871 RepID=A0AAV4LX84_BABCB|nr:nucleolar protein [Babesia caballi]
MEESTRKRPKKVNDAHALDVSGDQVVLPSSVRSWLSHIGVDVEEYQRALYSVANNLKKRYYRKLSQPIPDNKPEENPKTVSNLGNATTDEGLQKCATHTEECASSSETPRSGATSVNARENASTGDANSTCDHTHQPSTKNHVLVPWLRDVDLYEAYATIPEGSIGLDAASAAVIDALRLSELASQDGTKWILDMCCAPGGKLLGTVSTLKHLWGKGHDWKVIGLDVVKRRLDVCASLLRKENAPENIDVHLLNCRAQDFTEFEAESMIGRFDRVVLDAECTHEGSLRSVLRTLKFWGAHSLESRFTREHADAIIANQRELLRHAVRLTRPGGLVVYSTCSLHDDQDELLVASVVKEFDNVRLQQLPVVNCSCCSSQRGRTGVWPASSTESRLAERCASRYLPHRDTPNGTRSCANVESPVCVRFSPMAPDTDGIFLCAIRKMAN